ncbi:MAG: hypothetical protein QXW97_04350 [Candidatus Pacearchaeota archaeon]
MNASQLESLVNSQFVYKLFRGLNFSKTVLNSSTEKEENIYHNIDPNLLKDIKICPEGSTNEKGLCKKRLSNGRVAEIKIMPNTASERALERLRLKACNSENNCQIILKEVGKADKFKPVYELIGNKQVKFLGIFKMNAEFKHKLMQKQEK